MAIEGIKITFTEDGARLNWGERVSGLYATAQKALVNLGTQEGSARVHPDRGTGLPAAVGSGGLLDLASAQHAGNFAALDTLFFLRATGVTDDPDMLAECKVIPSALSTQRLELGIQLTSNAGAKLGLVTPL